MVIWSAGKDRGGLGGGYELKINCKSSVLEESDDVASKRGRDFSGTNTKLRSFNMAVIDAN